MNEIPPSSPKFQTYNYSKKKSRSKSPNKNHSTNTIPSIPENFHPSNSQSKLYSINQTSKSFTFDDKMKQKSLNNSKIPSSQIIYNNSNNESSLLKNIHLLNSDNVKLREILKEIKLDLQEKEESLNESQKIINKLNFEYTQILNQYKQLEQEKNILKKENERLNKECTELNKILDKKEKINKKNEKLKLELIKTKELLSNLKGNYTNININYDKIEKDMKYKQILINDLQIEGNKIINMLQDRDILINEYSKKISELSDIIKNKDEQLKLMMNFSKELNKENKINIKEITKQAVKTINTFYNSRKNLNEPNQTNLVEIKQKEENKEKKENNDLTYNIISKNKCSFNIGEAIKNDLYIPNKGINYINKEFLEGKNLETCLLKTELYSNIIRESKRNYNFW